MKTFVQHKHDDAFVNNVKSNTLRYISFFEEVADEQLPASSFRHTEDIYDVLQVASRVDFDE